MHKLKNKPIIIPIHIELNKRVKQMDSPTKASKEVSKFFDEKVM